MASYTVKPGDSLSKIAQTYTGNPQRYTEIAAANRISDPRKIEVGQTLTLPVAWTAGSSRVDLVEGATILGWLGSPIVLLGGLWYVSANSDKIMKTVKSWLPSTKASRKKRR
jgi:LysM repeat protein